MQEFIPTRDDALKVLKEFNKTDSLLKHAYSVEAVMRYIARKRGEDEEKWAIVGLIHDLDYERYPAEHCKKTREILTERGWPEEYIQAAVSHGWGICTTEEPTSDMAKTLFAIDELTGLIAAAALVRPSKSVSDMAAKSVIKKWKDKAFAAGVDRSIIDNGVERLGVDRTELITDAIMGMREAREQIGL